MRYGIPYLVFAAFLIGGGLVSLWSYARGRRERWRKPFTVGAMIAGEVLVLWVLLSEYIVLGLFSASRDVRLARAEAIMGLRILPHDQGGIPELSETPVRITDRGLIDRVALALREGIPWHPSHPNSQWICVLALDYPSVSRYCEVHSTSNQGVVFTVRLGRGQFPTLGSYRNDALGSILPDAARIGASASENAAPTPHE